MTIQDYGLIAQALGSLLLLGGYVPQIVKLHKTRNPTGISALFWLMIAIGCTLILVNMSIQDAPIEVQITQLLNVIGAWYTISIVMYYRWKRSISTDISAKLIAIGLLISWIMLYYVQFADERNIGYAFQTIGTIALLTAYIPQIIYLYKLKDATGVSRWLYVILGSGLLLVTFNMIVTGTSSEIIFTEFVNIGLIMTQYVLTVHYQNQKLYKGINN
ncbi:PQ-loop domain-containing transporter [Virgibacillus sp. M23]|uniref:PQ-loop domain-containing transporter n=1 Tax=Virgibacillus sp. M23 TaxID=3079030 RepID=UPI002A915F75|nr:PQ-loop domain-containing transporter [Virgibacillus sp. M23]MDY7043614.1 PQ-loop domain-containing transporter [Virgibacillus sp. M23]